MLKKIVSLEANTWLPLFPLNTVLFPNGILPLRVFETRYIDMVRACMKEEKPFGVVLIKSGNEVGAAAEPEDIGCIAYIEEWDMAELGVLLLRTQGGERFRILQTRILADQRLEARTEMIAADKATPITSVHVQCAKALKIVIDDLTVKAQTGQENYNDRPFASPIQLDNVGWVANRWCEILPISVKARQKLLELTDPQMRLGIVFQYLQQHGIL